MKECRKESYSVKKGRKHNCWKKRLKKNSHEDKNNKWHEETNRNAVKPS